MHKNKQTITIKISGILFHKNQDKQLVKLSVERKQVVDEIFCNISCLSMVNYEKNVRI